MITQYRNKKTIFFYLFLPNVIVYLYTVLKVSVAQQQHFEQSRSFFFNVCLQEINNPYKKDAVFSGCGTGSSEE